ncbi:hypothetical protein P4O66_005332 [Electrophorus voltai]|uniref:CCDC113/CCDC96 coiled-coil domain-containing protein n=1 Tax=Electrophorus voltai TaxID=2609070 RepID=A0AAD8ZWV4_9TELE|nr:hypothetical protein P4O66_005332 [Electrophorus voltai]
MPVCTRWSRHGYQDQLKILEDLKLQWQCKSQLYQQQVEELRPQCQEKKKQWDCEYQAFIMMMQEVLLAALARRLGKRAALVEVKRLLAAEQKTENKLTAAKIRNLALQMRVQSREEAIGELEERTKAEKLKFENENYKTMILEYEEQVIRIKKGITSTREFQSHLKETINFVELEIQAKLANLAKIKAMIGNKRKALAGVMITKDKLRADNLRLCQRCSLLRNKKLLQDFEKVKDACEDLQSQLDILKRQHEKLSVKIHIKRQEAPVDMEKRKRGCTKLPPIRPNHSAQKANNVQALDVGMHSPETRDSTHFAPLVLPPINGSHPLPFQRKKGSYEQLQKTGLDGCHDNEASKEQLEMEDIILKLSIRNTKRFCRASCQKGMNSAS